MNRLIVCSMTFSIFLCNTSSAQLTTTRTADTKPAISPALQEVLSSSRDVWGEAAMRQPGGPTYEFFKDLLPPLRYVNAAFRHYPIVLSAPGGMVKARLVSNGSAINALAGIKTWREVGTPVEFEVGTSRIPFGSVPEGTSEPELLEGWLPVVRVKFRLGGTRLEQESFASCDPHLATYGAVFVRLASSSDSESPAAHIEGEIKTGGSTVTGADGKRIVLFDSHWEWDGRNRYTSRAGASRPATMCILTRPCPPSVLERMEDGEYERQREACVRTWRELLERGTQINVPEPLVNNAWKSLVIGTFMLAKGDQLCYSAGNAYERQYEVECGDAVRALLLYGYADDGGNMIPPLLAYNQKGLAAHDAGFKLQLLAHHYWLTRDRAFIEKQAWKQPVDFILRNRDAASGLLPQENWCGDLHQQVHTLTSNACCWRGLQEIAAVLKDVGNEAESQRIREQVASFRRSIETAVITSEYRDVKPPFIPVALFGKEPPHHPLTATMEGSYWNLIIPYVLDSGVFGPKSQRTQWILDTLHEQGGVCMGMIRFDQQSGLFANEKGLDDLYGLRYVVTLLQRDEVDRALVSFYGKLAQGFTRDTFIGAEGTGLVPLDEHGRPMYLPPNASSNALLLWTLRYLLVQDWDFDDDGEPETLRLLFAAPRQWLEDEKSIRIEHAPTAFGPVTLSVESHLSRGYMTAEVDCPPRPSKRMLLRLRLPPGWRIARATTRQISFLVDSDGAIDLSGLRGKIKLRFVVERE